MTNEETQDADLRLVLLFVLGKLEEAKGTLKDKLQKRQFDMNKEQLEKGIKELEKGVKNLEKRSYILSQTIKALSFKVEELSRMNLTQTQKAKLRQELHRAETRLGLA